MKELHLLNRLGFGPRPGEIEKVKSLGIDAYVQSQLSPDSITYPRELQQQLSQLEAIQLTTLQLYRKFGPPSKKKGEKKQKNQGGDQKRPYQILREAAQGRIMRAVASPRQLEEVMVDFWFNHFNVFAHHINRLWVGSYEQEAIRPHAIGHFRQLLGATARHPAMLLYLDNWLNTAPESPGARGRFRGLNENYARELLELHTLGVDGGYTQDDVIVLARIFTGWGFPPQEKGSDKKGEFYFDENRHDFSQKVLLGQTVSGRGMAEGEAALDILANHPATANYISYKLAEYFVADDPPQSLVKRLARRFMETQGDIRAVLETLCQSEEFWDPQFDRAKFKTPYQYIMSGLRATDVKIEKYPPIIGSFNQLAMPIYQCRTPNGYQQTQDTWLSPDAMLRRISFAIALGQGRFSDRQPVDAVKLAQTIGDSLSIETKKIVDSYRPKEQAALILGSPEFMRC